MTFEDQLRALIARSLSELDDQKQMLMAIEAYIVDVAQANARFRIAFGHLLPRDSLREAEAAEDYRWEQMRQRPQ